MVNVYNTHVANQGIPFDEMQAVCVDLLRDPCQASNQSQVRESGAEEVDSDMGVRLGGETFDVVVVSFFFLPFFHQSAPVEDAI